LRQLGGTEGVGVTFLEETFSAPSAHPKHRLHEKAARAVLKALLPQTGTDIKGRMRPESELREASGYASRPRDFDELVHLLDHDLHLITPTDPGDATTEGQAVRPEGAPCHQLTHDYLVPSLRDWLTRKQRETRRGRAELRLAELSAHWSAKPENRHLPSVLDWAGIRLLTRRRDWSEPERGMMRRAGQVHVVKGLGLAILLALAAWAGIEGYGNLRAAALVDSLKTAGTMDVPPILQQISNYRRWADFRLRRMLHASDDQSRDRLHASLALLEVDPSQVDFLFGRLRNAAPTVLPILREALGPYRLQLTSRLWGALDSAQPGGERLLQPAGALALYDPEHPRWATLGGKVAEALVTVRSPEVGPWLDVLRPVRGQLTGPLAAIFRDKNRSETVHSLVTDILADYGRDEPGLLAELMMVSDPKAYASLFPVIERQVAQALPLFQAEIARDPVTDPSPQGSEELKDALAQRQARAAVALIRLGHASEVWPLLRHKSDPRLRSFIVNWLSPLGADPKMLVAELDRRNSPATRQPPLAPQKMDAILFHPETSMRRALILALGQYGQERLSAGERELLIAKLLDLYQHDPDAGIHGAAEWTLWRWKRQAELQEIDARLRGRENGGRRWYMTGQGQTFVLVEGPVGFRMGSPRDEPDRDPGETPHRRVIPRRFAIAAKEVSVEQYQRFLQENRQFARPQDNLDQFTQLPDGPMIGVSWFYAVAYCNWLSKKEGLPEEQWCYSPKERGEYDQGMRIPADALLRTGYRLPTEAEWEYSCRAGTVTSRYYGLSIDLLQAYAWNQANSQDHAWRCGSLLPNDLGLFDMLGNVYEWCHEQAANYHPERVESEIDEILDRSVERHIRGGTFSFRPAIVRSASRDRLAPTSQGIGDGFRPARTFD
jgi:formylglycine-generating enzyme required for sulfatase activity